MYARDTRSSSLPAAAGQRGMALLTTILMMTLMSALLVGFTTAVMSDQAYRSVDRDRARAFYGAQSGIEKQNADLAQLFLNQVGPSDAQIIALGATTNRPTIPDVTFVDVGTSPAYQVQPLGPAANSVLSSGPYAGLIALTRQIQLDATARAIDGGEVHLRRLVETFAIPVFQFGIFSTVDLSFSAAENFSFGGRVHTNANLFLAQGAGTTLTLSDRVTAVGQIVRQRLSNRESIDASGSTGTVSMTRGNTTGPFRALARTEGSVTDGVFPAPTPNTSWPNISLSTYNGNIRNGLTGVTPLNLDLVTANGANIDLIKRPPASESVSSPIFAERYFKKVSVRVLLSDDPNDIMSLPTVSSGAPVPLDGDWFAAPPAGYTAVPAAYPAPITNAPAPVARSIGPYPDVPAGSINSTVNASVTAGANQTIVINPLMPDFFRLQPNMTLSWNAGASSMTVTCTGKDALQFTGCSRTGGATLPQTITLPATISSTFATIDGNRTVTANLTTAPGTWNSGTRSFVLGTAGFPTANFSVNTFFINGGNGLRNFLVTCTGFNTTPAFTGCNVPAPISSGDRISTEALSNAGVGRIGGFLKVEIQRTPNVWQDVTMEVLNHGISGPNLAGRPCADPTPNAILRFQRLRDNNEPATLAQCTYAQPGMPIRSTDHWPNVLFDAREGWVRDSNGSAFGPTGHGNRVTINGVMHYVTLDVRNLSLWFQGTGVYAGGSGPLAMREGNSPTGGFSLYFSDRRNNRDDANRETGEYGYEDVVNPADTMGAPNVALDLGEDMNGNGQLDRYGRQPSYQGVINAVPPGAIAPLAAGSRPTDYITVGQARVNRPLHFRRALKLVNGTLGNIVAPGLTVAAENPVYVQGHWNANAAGFGGTNVATSVAADAVTLLSHGWNDVNSWGLPFATTTDARHLNPWWMGHRPRAGDTYYRLAIISGKGPVFPRPSGAGATYGTDGGVHSFLRFIEGDGGTDRVWYMGSMVTFYYHRQATSPFKCCGGMVYGVPVRQYSFDVTFLDPARLPPLTPVFRDINALGFLQETRPGK